MKTKIIILFTLVTMLSACEAIKNQDKDQASKEEVARKTAMINTQLGMAYLQQQDMQRAKQKFLLALKQAPEIPEPWYGMGYFLEATGNVSQAKYYYVKAIEAAPGRGDVHNNFGTFLCRAGKYQLAVNQFMTAVKDSNYLDMSGAYENAGVCARKIPDNKQALYYFARAIKQDPQRPVALYNMAELYYQEGDYQQAQNQLSLLASIMNPSAEVKQLEEQINKKLALQSKHASLVAALDNAKTFKQVVNVSKDHGVTVSGDPLLPFPPRIHEKILTEKPVTPIKNLNKTIAATKITKTSNTKSIKLTKANKSTKPLAKKSEKPTIKSTSKQIAKQKTQSILGIDGKLMTVKHTVKQTKLLAQR